MNKKFVLKPIAIAVSALSFSNVYAETAPASSDLPEVKVSASKLKQEVVDGYMAKRSTTATKTDTELNDVPQSISVTTQDQIKDQAVRSIEDAIRYTPGVTMAQGEGNRDAVVFRGNQSTADFFLDGVRDDVQYYRDLYNIDRVEVLRGPNGMIFGRGGAGGVINRVSKEATLEPIRELTLQAGSYDQRRAAIDLGQAINDVAAIRLNAMVENANSYRDGVSLRRHGINPTVTLFPTEKTKVVLSAEYFMDHRTADRGIPSQNGRPFSTNESTFFGNARLSPTEVEVQNYSALVEHAFDNGVTVRNRTRYSDYDKYYQNVFAGSAVGTTGNYTVSAYRDDTQRENFFNQTDFLYTLNSGSISHKLLGGFEFGRQDTDSIRTRPTGGTLTTTQSAFSPTFRGPVPFNQVQFSRQSEVDVAAVYLQDQIVFSPKFEAVIGARLDQFETNSRNNLTGQRIRTEDDLFSPRGGLIFKPVDNLSLYTSYSQSYVPRAGEQLTSLTSVTVASFDPEKFKNTEVGAKWDVNPSLALTAAAFKLERTNVAVSTDSMTSALIDGQVTRGVELGVTGRVTNAWSIIGAYTLQKAELLDTTSVGADGSIAPNTPRQAFSLWNRYDFNETWGAALGVISRSDMYASFSNNVKLPGYTRVDAAVYAKLDKNLRLQLNVENLLNKEYFLYAHSDNNITPGSPTAARATLIYNF